MNGEKIETESGFTDQGSEISFELAGKMTRILGEQTFSGFNLNLGKYEVWSCKLSH